MEFLIQFWRNLKKDSVESDKYEGKNVLLVFTVVGLFFHGSRSEFLADPDPDLGKKVRSGSGIRKKSSIWIRKKPGSKKLLFFSFSNFYFTKK